MTAQNDPVKHASAVKPPLWVEVEPPPGSVVLTESLTGTAWQRHNKDGLWHSTTGRVLPWNELGYRRGEPNFRTLVYAAPIFRVK